MAAISLAALTLGVIAARPADAVDEPLQVVKTSWQDTDCPDFVPAFRNFFPTPPDGNVGFVGVPFSYCFVISNLDTDAPLFDVEVHDNASTPADTTDDFFVQLFDPSGTALGTTADLGPGDVIYGTASRTFTSAGEYTNTATATANLVDDDPSTAVSTDDLTQITIFGVTITKEPDATVVDEGDLVSFSFTVENESLFEPFNLTGMNDSVFGDVTTYTAAGDGDCALPVVVSPLGTYTCAITVPLDSTGLHTNTITATGTAPDGTVLEAEDDAEVTVNDLPASIEVDKSADITALPLGGGPVTFTFTVTNTSAVDVVTIDSLVDDTFGDLADPVTCAVPAALAPGDQLICTITENVTGPDDTFHENTVTATGTDDDSNPIEGSDNQLIAIGDPSSVEVVKTPDVSEVPESGGDVVYTFTVTNTSAAADVTVDTMADDIFGDLSADCALPRTLAPGADFSCSIVRTIAGNAGDQHTNVVSVSGQDEFGSPVSGSDEASVSFSDEPSALSIGKTANLASVPASGGSVDFTFSISNDSAADTITVDSLVDSVFGDITAECGLVPALVMAPGNTHTCVITRVIASSGSGGSSYTNPPAETGSSSQLLAHTEPDPCLGGQAWTNGTGQAMGAFGAGVLVLDTGLTLPAGTWAVHDFLTWDADIDRPGYPQNHESLRIEFFLNGARVAASAATPELIDGTVTAWSNGGLGTVTLPNGADEVKIVHSNVFALTTGTNSLDPVSLCLLPVTDDTAHRNVATVCGTDDDGAVACEADDAVVEFSDEPACLYGLGRNYWRRQASSWPAGINPNDLVTSHFGPDAALNGGNDTLLDALSYAGGGGLDGGKRRLLRDAVAGLLNEAYFGPNYPAASVAAFTAEVSAELASGSRADLIAKAREIRDDNRGTCPVPRDLRPHRQ